MIRTCFVVTSLLVSTFLHAFDKPTVASVSVDNNDRRIVIVTFKLPEPDAVDVQKADYWLVFSEGKTARRHSVIGVNTSLLNAAEAKKNGVKAALVEHSIKLQLSEELPTDVTKLYANLFNNKVFVAVPAFSITPPTPTTPNAKPTPPIPGAKSQAESDIYFNGSFTGVKDGDPVWDIDA